MDRHDNANACKAVYNLIADMLFTLTDTTVSIHWVLGSGSFLLLKRLAKVATMAATMAGPDLQPHPATITALCLTTKLKSITEWELIWQKDPHRNPVYCTLHHPPNGSLPEFMQGIVDSACPVFYMAVRLLTEHAFTGEYNTRHRPCVPNPHNCQCSCTNMQTPLHVILDCHLFREAQEHFLRPATADLSINMIFGVRVSFMRRVLEVTVHAQDTSLLW
jgi:hypothetical protein